MEIDSSFHPEVAYGDNWRVKDDKLSVCQTTIARDGTAMGQATKRSARKSRKNYVPVKIARIEEAEPSIHKNGFESDESDDYDVNVIAPEQGLPPLAQPSEEKMRCEQEATQMVNDANLVLGDRSIKSPQLNDLIASLTSLMLQIKSLAKGDMNSVGYSSLNESIADLKKKIHPSNHKCFEDNVEVHIAHIQSGMSQMGNLHAFSERHVSY
nr:protein lin-9 homolog [Lytechinus pictus]